MGAEKIYIGKKWYWRLKFDFRCEEKLKIMDLRVLSKIYLDRGRVRIRYAEAALLDGNYPYVVRQSQEAVELLLKAALRYVGIESPKWHDVGPVLKRERDRFPEWFNTAIDELASISRSLRNERELAMYGDEGALIPPEEFYSKLDAEEVLSKTRKVYKLVSKLIAGDYIGVSNIGLL